MCELFGFSSIQPEPIQQELEEFFSHSHQHPHGWGLVTWNGQKQVLWKQPIPAYESDFLKAQLAQRLEAQVAIGHIRYATIGNVEDYNCHPFQGRDRSGRFWTLAHNGTIFSYDPMNPYIELQNGDTDSERILLYLIHCINDRTRKLGRPLTAEERFEVVDDLVVAVSPGNKLNLLIYDGELLYAHTNYANTMYYRQTQGSVCISTQALHPGVWQPVPFTTLQAFYQGRLFRSGTNHGSEYFVDEKQMEMLYLAFSNL